MSGLLNEKAVSAARTDRRRTSPRLPAGASLLISLDHEAREPLYRQIYRALRDAVLAGRLVQGARLPSTRTLASDLGVSRNTVLAAYDQLLAEGYLDGRIGSGTRVTGIVGRARATHAALRARATRDAGGAGPSPPGRDAVSVPAPRSRRDSALSSLPMKLSLIDGASRAFRPGVPALDEFPARTWRRLLARRWQRAGPALLDYGDPAGFGPLRQAIAAYLGAARGVRCDPRQVIIVSGSQQALDLTARVLLDPGDSVWLEDPGYHGARGAFVAAGARVVGVPVDNEGLNVEAGRAKAPDARLAYISPSHQFPLGVTMSLARRLALLEWARESRAWLLEDDYDSEYRYASRPISALQGIDATGRVIYTGTFSKVLFPALRLGYLVVPDSMVDAFTAARLFADMQSPTVEQAVLADFIAGGHFERHIRRTRALYQERQQALVTAASRELAPGVTIGAAEAGMHVVGWLPEGVDDRAVSRAAASRDVDVIPLSAFALDAPRRGGLLFGYAHLSPREIADAVARLRPVVALLSADTATATAGGATDLRG